MKPIAICHIPKTGGTSLHQFIASAGSADSVSKHIVSENYYNAMSASARYGAVIGHFWFRPGERLDPLRLNFTVSRDPIDRILSHFYFSRGLNATLHPSAPERFMDLDADAASELSSVLSTTFNFQTRLLAPLGLAAGVLQPTDNDLLLAALRAVDSFEIVGIFPELEDTATCIAYLAGISAGTQISRANVTAGRPAVADLSDDVRRRLESLNELDRELMCTLPAAFCTASPAVCRQCEQLGQPLATRGRRQGKRTAPSGNEPWSPKERSHLGAPHPVWKPYDRSQGGLLQWLNFARFRNATDGRKRNDNRSRRGSRVDRELTIGIISIILMTN